MRGLLWFLGLSFLAVATALLVQYNDGIVFVVLPPWQVEFTLNFLIAVLLLGFFLGYVLVQSFLFSMRLPIRARAWREARQKKQVDALLSESIRLLFEGRFGHALRRAEAAWKKGDDQQGTAALIAARAAQRLRAPEKTRFWLQRAQTAMPEAAAAIGMIDAETAVEEGDFSQALALLSDLQRKEGRHIAALRLELQARQHLSDATGVLKLTRQLEKHGGMSAEVAAAIRRRTHEKALAQRQGDAAQLLLYFEGLRREERAPNLAYAVATSLSRLGDEDAAAKLIETALEEGEWSSDLAALYGRLGLNEMQPDFPGAPQHASRILTARIARADAWLTAHPDDSRLLLALGRLCERQKLWGKAQNYLEASLALKASREGYLALAHLLDTLGETEAANRLFRLAAECDHSFE